MSNKNYIEQKVESNLINAREIDNPEFKQFLSLMIKNKFVDKRSKIIIGDIIPNTKLVLQKPIVPGEVAYINNNLTINLIDQIKSDETAINDLKNIGSVYALLVKGSMRKSIQNRKEVLKNALLATASAKIFLRLMSGFIQKDANYRNPTAEEESQLFAVILMYFLTYIVNKDVMSSVSLARTVLREIYEDEIRSKTVNIDSIDLRDMDYNDSKTFYLDVEIIVGKNLNFKQFIAYQMKMTPISLEAELSYEHFIADIYASYISGYTSTLLSKTMKKPFDHFMKVCDSIIY